MARKRLNHSLPARLLQPAVHIGALIPLGLLVYDFFTHNLTANPIQAATLRTGKTALVLLVLSLACSPLSSLFGLRVAIKARRPLGLYAALYATVHFLIFIWVDLGLSWTFIVDGFLQKPYALVGFAAFLILVPLALTSTRGMQRLLGKNWKRLHRLVYAAGVLVIIHYVWLVKSDIRQPLLWGLVLAVLLSVRNTWVKRRLLRRTGPKRAGRDDLKRQPVEAETAGSAQ